MSKVYAFKKLSQAICWLAEVAYSQNLQKGISMNTLLLIKQLFQPAEEAKQYPLIQDLLIALSKLPQSKKLLSNDLITIHFGENGKQVRKVNKRSNARVTGKFPSRKNHKMITWESKIELNGYQLLEANPLVKAYLDQPAIIHYLFDNVSTPMCQIRSLSSPQESWH